MVFSVLATFVTVQQPMSCFASVQFCLTWHSEV